ncbi:cysteine hydrolase [Campylobacter sp. faydin G-24]|uniref:Cysteine hydrolase n=1 Tax=Campylobacter anatolicus TaxID=2829105 RepID=A0ABS5HFN7_9BACT|nr:isochorismatase family cysteine hydrolase [Campylobacter anatolicus]MBR8463053.1 cysteine hydrolase [Campylobacter anatolicus]MBR8465626.1 cysteine hydrolase [Campylobacter anatolicus]
MKLTPKSYEFLKTLQDWSETLSDMSLDDLLSNDARNVAFVSVDLINGFCKEGMLSSPRVGAIGNKVAHIFAKAYKRGLRNFILIQDRHSKNSAEFDVFAPHCIGGTNEAETIDELKKLEFFDEIKIFYKNSIDSAYCVEFNKFLELNPQIDTFVVFGNCTDICVYHLASHLKLSANEHNIKRNVIVPAKLVQTYDALSHDADFYHLVFLNHLQFVADVTIVRNLH